MTTATGSEKPTDRPVELTAQQIQEVGAPPGGRWFFTQEPMLELYRAGGEKGLLLGWDRNSAKIFGLYENITPEELMTLVLAVPIEKRHGYELIYEFASCKFYLDIEWYGPADPQHAKLTEAMAAVREKLKSPEGPMSDDAEIYVACGTRPVKTKEGGTTIKHSYHAVVDNLAFDRNTKEMEKLVKLIEEDSRLLGPDGKSILDSRVYSRNRNMRLPHCCKHGSKVPLIRISDEPREDDYTYESPGDGSDVLEFFLSKPDKCGDRIFIRAQADTRPPATGERLSKRAKSSPGAGSGRDKLPPFPLAVIKALLEDAGDTVTTLKDFSYMPEEGQWRIQGDQHGQIRQCLATPGECHEKNNCILFVKKEGAGFKVSYQCMAAGCSKKFLTFLTYDTDLGEWLWELSDSQSETTTERGAKKIKVDPAQNTYEMVKARFEELIFKIYEPVGAYVLLKPEHLQHQPPYEILSLQQMQTTYYNLYYY